MSKVIIQNDSSHKTEDVLLGVIEVIKQGRISGSDLDTYCYITTFEAGYAVASVKNLKSDKFVIIDN
jgi:hypothetical protein